jgi:hypothetical protein
MPNYDGNQVAHQFIECFYNSQTLDMLLTNNIIKPYSKLNLNGTIYMGNDIISILNHYQFRFDPTNCELLDSGSRQIYILTTGNVFINDIPMSFSQSFMISYVGNKSGGKWTLINTILLVKFIF